MMVHGLPQFRTEGELQRVMGDPVSADAHEPAMHPAEPRVSGPGRCLSQQPGSRPTSALELGELLDAIEAPAWTRQDGERWWRERAPRVLATVQQRRSAGSTPGPRTIAVDLERRTPRSAPRRAS